VNATSWLKARSAALLDRLNQVQAAIRPTDDLARRIADPRVSIENQLKRLDNAGARADTETWEALSASESECREPLLREALHYMHGKQVPPLDPNGPKLLADALLAELADSCGLRDIPIISPDLDELFSEFSGIIRMRFPPPGIWDVPVIAHEFGHYVAYRLTGPAEAGVRRPQSFAEYVDWFLSGIASKKKREGKEIEGAEKDKWASWLYEYFADMFATYALGPSFAASALLLRFGIVGAYSNNDAIHPSSGERAAVILEALRFMDQNADAQFIKPRAWLAAQWNGLLRSAGEPADFAWDTDSRSQRAKLIARTLYPVLRRLAPNVLYNRWNFVDTELRFSVGSPRREPQRACTVPDLLNAAWLCRSLVEDSAVLSADALRLWRDQAVSGRAVNG
jgi:hypothetical protein